MKRPINTPEHLIRKKELTMKIGYYIQTSSNHKLVLLWILIILGFNRILFYELNQSGNWFFTISPIVLYIVLLFLIIPRRLFIVRDKIYITIFPFIKFKTINMTYITELKITKFGFKFHYSGKCYQFICSNSLIISGLMSNN